MNRQDYHSSAACRSRERHREEKARNGFLRCNQRSFGPSRGTKLRSEKYCISNFFTLYTWLSNQSAACCIPSSVKGKSLMVFSAWSVAA